MTNSNHTVKDFNALLQKWKEENLAQDTQILQVRNLLRFSRTMVEEVCAEVQRPGLTPGELEGKRKTALEMVAALDDTTYADYAAKLASLMGIGKRELDNSRSARRKTEKKNGRIDPGTETLGGNIKGYLVEYIYDAKEREAHLVVRDPQGKIEVVEEVFIDEVKYVPMRNISFIEEGGVLFPSELGKLRSEQELASIIALFIQRYYLLEDANFKWVLAFYVMLTWLYDIFPAIPYLMATGDAGAGKSELMQRIGCICYRLYNASGANTASTFFRVSQMFKPTVFIDEADLADGGEMTNDIVKYLNQGAMRTGKITRMVETFNAVGEKVFMPELFSCFGPKLIAMRSDFADSAVRSRSIVLKLMAKEPLELQAAGVPLHINDKFMAEALAIRNDLLTWRMHRWQPEMQLTDDLMDLALSSRMNQVTMAIKAIGKLANNDDFRRQIDRVLRDLAAEETLTRSLSVEARILEAMWKVYITKTLREKLIKQAANGELRMLVGDICKIANGIMDEMNGVDPNEPQDEGSKKRRQKELTPQGTGHILRNNLQIRSGGRTNKGVIVIWDDLKMTALGRKYGVLPDEQEIEAARAVWARAAADVERFETMAEDEDLEQGRLV